MVVSVVTSLGNWVVVLLGFWTVVPLDCWHFCTLEGFAWTVVLSLCCFVLGDRIGLLICWSLIYSLVTSLETVHSLNFWVVRLYSLYGSRSVSLLDYRLIVSASGFLVLWTILSLTCRVNTQLAIFCTECNNAWNATPSF